LLANEIKVTESPEPWGLAGRRVVKMNRYATGDDKTQ